MYYIRKETVYDFENDIQFHLSKLFTEEGFHGYLSHDGIMCYEIDIKEKDGEYYVWIAGDWRVYEAVIRANSVILLNDTNSMTKIKYGQVITGTGVYEGTTFEQTFIYDNNKIRSINIRADIYDSACISNDLIHHYIPDFISTEIDTPITVQTYYSKEEYLKVLETRTAKVKALFEELKQEATYHSKIEVDLVDSETIRSYYDPTFHEEHAILIELKDVVLTDYNHNKEKYYINRMLWAISFDKGNINDLYFIHTNRILFDTNGMGHPHARTNGLCDMISLCKGDMSSVLDDISERFDEDDDFEDIAEDIISIVKEISSKQKGSPYKHFECLESHVAGNVSSVSYQNPTYPNSLYGFLEFLTPDSSENTQSSAVYKYMGCYIDPAVIDAQIQFTTNKKYYFKGEKGCTYQYFNNIPPVQQTEITKSIPNEFRIAIQSNYINATSCERNNEDITESEVQNSIFAQVNQQGRMVRSFVL